MLTTLTTRTTESNFRMMFVNVSADYVLPQDSEKARKPYHKIYGILLDMRTIMYRHVPRDRQLITNLAKVIEQV